MRGLEILLVASGYLAGSIPFGILLARLVAGVDPRAVGSGNIGATNVARAAGKGVGVLTAALDAAKASLPMVAARGLLAGQGPEVADAWAAAVGVAAVLGHLYPVWLGFKGGKGVATALGVFLVLAPLPALLALVAFFAAYGATRISAVGSLSGTAVCAVGTVWQRGIASPVAWAGLLLAALILWRHRSNIQRLVRGEERKI